VRRSLRPALPQPVGGACYTTPLSSIWQVDLAFALSQSLETLANAFIIRLLIILQAAGRSHFGFAKSRCLQWCLFPLFNRSQHLLVVQRNDLAVYYRRVGPASYAGDKLNAMATQEFGKADVTGDLEASPNELNFRRGTRGFVGWGLIYPNSSRAKHLAVNET